LHNISFLIGGAVAIFSHIISHAGVAVKSSRHVLDLDAESNC